MTSEEEVVMVESASLVVYGVRSIEKQSVR